jgi:Flp pilus assembly protein protease CpaA
MNLVFLSDIILVVLALICLAVASYTDLKKREVANWISFSLLVVAIVIRGMVTVITSVSVLIIIFSFVLMIVFLLGFYFYLRNDKPYLEYILAVLYIGVWYLFDQYLFFMNDYLISCFLAFGIFIIITNLMYYGKMSGGADVKVLLALSVVFATTPSFLNFDYNLFSPMLGFLIPKIFLFDFIVNCLFVGLVFGILFSVFMALRNKKAFSKKFKEVFKKYWLFELAMVVLGIVLSILSIYQKFLIVFGIALIIIPFLITFVMSVQESSMKRFKSWKELIEGDWLVSNVKIGKKLIKPSADGLTKKDILLIKKAGKKVLVLDGMPFVPVFLIALIISLIWGNLLFLLLNVLV